MASDYSIRFRLNFQAPGDNLNLWGVVLNAGVFQMLEDAIAKRLAFALSGTKTLTTVNGAADEARCAYLDVTGGTGGTIVTPELEKWYIVHNGASGPVTVTADAGGADVVVDPGETVFTVCDGVNYRKIQATSFDGGRLTSLGNPVDLQDAATKAYVDALAFNAINLPGQGAGTIGKWIRSNGTVASWQSIAVADVAGAAPLAAPSFTGGVDVAGGLDVVGGLGVVGVVRQDGGSVSEVVAVPAVDLDFSDSDWQTKAISANTAFTVSGLQAGKAQVLILVLTITSAAVPSFPAWVKFAGGINPLGALGNGVHWLSIATINGGTTGLLKVVGKNVS